MAEELQTPAALPFPPMEAELVDALPEGDGWQFEPKWDGFRGIAENLDGDFHLWSRNARPLLRYFPELAALGELLPPRSAVDGEIVVVQDGALDFDALQMRLHPAESRVKKLSAEIPAGFICFDVLLWDGEGFHERPFAERRAKVETLPFDISPGTRDIAEAARWLERLDVAGFDGVIAKRLELPYMPGSREAVQKVKGEKTADCVVVGVTWSEKGTGIASLMLGLFDQGELRPVGSAPATGKKREEILGARRAAPRREPRAQAARRAEPLEAEGRPRVEPGAAGAGRRGPLRQVAEGPLPPQLALPPLPPGQGPGAVHGRPGPPAPEEGRPHGPGPPRPRAVGSASLQEHDDSGHERGGAHEEPRGLSEVRRQPRDPEQGGCDQRQEQEPDAETRRETEREQRPGEQPGREPEPAAAPGVIPSPQDQHRRTDQESRIENDHGLQRSAPDPGK